MIAIRHKQTGTLLLELPGNSLAGAPLSGAVLMEADLRKADLRGADLRGARMEGTDFYLVDLRDARFTPEQE